MLESRGLGDVYKRQSLTNANKLPREIPNAMKTVSTGPFPKSMMDARKGYLRNVRQGYITPTPEPIKGITGATSIGKKPGTGVAIHPSTLRLDKHFKSRGVKTKSIFRSLLKEKKDRLDKLFKKGDGK